MTIDEAIEHAKEVTKKVNCKECADEHEQLVKWLEELKHYKKLEEQGRLIELPCNVGDKVYAYCKGMGILEYEIVIDKNITYRCAAYSEPIGDYQSECLDEIEPNISDFGKTVFLTKEEAFKHQNKPNHVKDIVYKFSVLSDAKKRNLLRAFPYIIYNIDEPIDKLIDEIKRCGIEEKFLEKIKKVK